MPSLRGGVKGRLLLLGGGVGEGLPSLGGRVKERLLLLGGGESEDARRLSSLAWPGRERPDDDRAQRLDFHEPGIFRAEAEAAGGGHHGIGERESRLVVGGQVNCGHRNSNRSNTGPWVQASWVPRATSTAQPWQAPTPQAMGGATSAWAKRRPSSTRTSRTMSANAG